jgi:dienelactone hydrolase
MGGRLLIPFAADHPSVKAIVLYYPSVRDEPETSHRPRHAFHLAKTLQCASLVFCAGLDYIATPAIQGPLWQSFITNGKLVEWHFFSDANHGFRHPDNGVFSPTTRISPGRSRPASCSAPSDRERRDAMAKPGPRASDGCWRR